MANLIFKKRREEPGEIGRLTLNSWTIFRLTWSTYRDKHKKCLIKSSNQTKTKMTKEIFLNFRQNSHHFDHSFEKNSNFYYCRSNGIHELIAISL